MILLDLAGPLTVFNLMRGEVHLVAKDRTPVPTDVGTSIAPAMTLEQCPAHLDVLFVPGGLEGTVAAGFVTSVCTGSLLLGTAGLLRGYVATSHWYVRDLLGLMGATAKADRVVVDRNRVTAAGVTGGLDFAFALARQIRGGCPRRPCRPVAISSGALRRARPLLAPRRWRGHGSAERGR